MEIEIPEFCLVILTGCSGSGKSTFAASHFLDTEIISSDRCRAMVCDDENDQNATRPAFEILFYIAERRLAAMKTTVIDATNLEEYSRQKLRVLAKQYHAQPIVIAITAPLEKLRSVLEARTDRNFPEEVLENQFNLMQRSMHRFAKEGFRVVHLLKREELKRVVITRRKMKPDWRDLTGSFDLIGDIHGCIHETKLLLEKLGYEPSFRNEKYRVKPPPGRKLFFLGDLVDRGPDSPQVLKLVMDLVDSGDAYCLQGNHEAKLLRKLNGAKVNPTHGMSATLKQLKGAKTTFLDRIRRFIESMESHYVLDEGKLVVAHAGMVESMQGKEGGAAHAFGLYGKSTGELDEKGLPIRLDWAMEYRGRAMVVYGHTPVEEAVGKNNTLCIDTGCVFGGKLTALSYPELKLTSVPAARVYYKIPQA